MGSAKIAAAQFVIQHPTYNLGKQHSTPQMLPTAGTGLLQPGARSSFQASHSCGRDPVSYLLPPGLHISRNTELEGKVGLEARH